MKKIFLALIFGIFLIGLVSASGIKICIDHIPPSAVSNLNAAVFGSNIQLSWTAATDEPSCSGISHYEIYRSLGNGTSPYLNSTTGTTYIDYGLSSGTYSYLVHSFDLAGHNEGNGVLVTATIGGSNNNNNGGGGGGGGSLISVFKCGNWSKCIQNSNSNLRGAQTRVCQDLVGIQTNQTESKPCIPEFVPNPQGNLNKTGNQINLTNSSTNETMTPAKTAGFFTGAAIGAGNLLKSNKLAFFFIIFIFLLAIFIILKKRKSKKKK